MKRPWIVALLGLVLGLSAYAALYLGRTAQHRHLEATWGPELAWLKSEFRLDDAHFDRIRQLHEAYKPVCAEYCRQIDNKQGQLAKLLNTSTQVTPEIEQLLAEANSLRTECQREMLKHFFQVSQSMPPEQGRRYLAWMHSETLSPSHESMVPQMKSKSPSHPEAHH
jgi:hypothetical protein